MNNPEIFKKEFLEYQKSYSFLNIKEFLEQLSEGGTEKCLASLFTEITDATSLELRDFETEGENQRFSGTKIIGVSKEKTPLYQKALVSLNLLKTGDVFLKIFSKKDCIDEDVLVFLDENKIKWVQSKKASNGDFLEKIKISLKEKILVLEKEGHEIKFDDQH